MEDVVVDVGVYVFRIDEEAVYVEDAGADWGEADIVRVGCRHGCREILNMKLWLCGSLDEANKCECGGPTELRIYVSNFLDFIAEVFWSVSISLQHIDRFYSYTTFFTVLEYALGMLMKAKYDGTILLGIVDG